MRLGLLLLAMVGCGLLGGCASMVNGSTQVVPISSDPSGASVILDDTPAGVTPCKLTLDRKCDHLLVLRKDGYEEYSMELCREASAWVYGNLLCGGLLGLYADTQNGSQYEFVNDKVHVQLKPAGASQPSTASSGNQ